MPYGFTMYIQLFLVVLNCWVATVLDVNLLGVGKYMTRQEFSGEDVDAKYNVALYSSLVNCELHATPLTSSAYKWIARVVHARHGNYPYICSASCISERIFITALRCIHGRKVAYTTVLYKEHRLQVLTFVMPSQISQQAFDDIGFIVVDKFVYDFIGLPLDWDTIELVNRNRTGEGFQWFADWNISEEPENKVVAFAASELQCFIMSAQANNSLYELDVYVGINLCSLMSDEPIAGFQVPCYHPCTIQQFENKDPSCKRYLGVEGGAVIDKNGVLIGVATWGHKLRRSDLPVGFSVPNSKKFYDDYDCAMRIRDDIEGTENYQKLCG